MCVLVWLIASIASSHPAVVIVVVVQIREEGDEKIRNERERHEKHITDLEKQIIEGMSTLESSFPSL